MKFSTLAALTVLVLSCVFGMKAYSQPAAAGGGITETAIVSLINEMNAAGASGNKAKFQKLLQDHLAESAVINITTQASTLGSASMPTQQAMTKAQYVASVANVIDKVREYKYSVQLTGQNIIAGGQMATFTTQSSESGKMQFDGGASPVNVAFGGSHTCSNAAEFSQGRIMITNVNCQGTSQIISSELDEMMKQSAEFYQGAVLKLQKPKGLLGVFDLMNLVQLPQGIVSKDFGGTLFSQADDELADVEGLIVMSLFDTLQMLRTTTVPAAFIATFEEHSIVFLAQAGGSVMQIGRASCRERVCIGV
jgi:hypothetical protein